MKKYDFAANIRQLADKIPDSAQNIIQGRVKAINGLCLQAQGLQAAIGDLCCVTSANNQQVYAEVVGFKDNLTILVAAQDVRGISINAQVRLVANNAVPISKSLIGRVVDWQGKPLDAGSVIANDYQPLKEKIVNVLERKPITKVMDVGVQAINALCTVGIGQRLGLFAGSGVGKSVLLGMITKYSSADVVVVGLIGERGREVQEFISQILGEDGMQRAVVVAVPSDSGALHKVYGTEYCTKIAQYFRGLGLKVLLLIDSLTRYAQALREIGLAAGELPIAQGFVPSVFIKLPQLLEKAGNTDCESGAITAIYTVLVEGDDLNEPLSDCVRGIVDGHIVLSRDLANQGHFPAIDIGASISRVMPQLVSREHYQAALKMRQLWSAYQQNHDLIKLGAYVAGRDSLVDEAIYKFEAMRSFLVQNADVGSDFALTYANLLQISDS